MKKIVLAIIIMIMGMQSGWLSAAQSPAQKKIIAPKLISRKAEHTKVITPQLEYELNSAMGGSYPSVLLNKIAQYAFEIPAPKQYSVSDSGMYCYPSSASVKAERALALPYAPIHNPNIRRR